MVLDPDASITGKDNKVIAYLQPLQAPTCLQLE